MKAKIFERCLIWVICQKAEEFEEPINESDLSDGVFEVGHPVNAWRSTRNSGRPLSLQEAYRLAEKINLSFEHLCSDVSNELRRGWTMEQDVSLNKPSPGRPKRKGKQEKNAPQKNKEALTTEQICAPEHGAANES